LRVGVRAAVVLGMATLPLLLGVSLHDLPPPVRVVVNGEPVSLSDGTTFGGAIRMMHLRPRPGRLLDVQGGVLEARADPGRILLNGDVAPRSRGLRSGDRISVVNGTDRTEGTRRVVDRLPGRHPGDPQYSLATSRMEQITVVGRRSGKVVSVRYRSIGRSHAPPAVALTFDDGPWPKGTRGVLTVLERMHAKATFFMIGYLVDRYPAIARDVARAGMAVGNHSWDHVEDPPFAKLKPHRLHTELAQANQAIGRATGVHPTLFRPPAGSWDPEVLTVANRLGMRIALWDVDPRDWAASATPRSIAANVLRNVRPGAVVDLHDGGGDAKATIRALPKIIRGIRKMGLQLVTMDQQLPPGPR
jgi:peptidoglycan/xylan/chitin deacetylase (PgdA/CDA1 family)/sulfur carrier protein ThiS